MRQIVKCIGSREQGVYFLVVVIVSKRKKKIVCFVRNIGLWANTIQFYGTRKERAIVLFLQFLILMQSVCQNVVEEDLTIFTLSLP